MGLKKIALFVIGAVLVTAPYGYAQDDDFEEDFMYEEYEEDDYDYFDDDIEDLVEEIDESETSVNRKVSERLSCDDIAVRISELREDVKAYPELKTDLESMLAQQRNKCAPRASHRPVHNYRNVNPVVDVEVPESVALNQDTVEVVSENAVDETKNIEIEIQTEIIETRIDGVCVNNAKPNKYGCCEGEVFKQMEHLDFACCPKVGDGECYAPIKK
ncbi:MAG: hypothetical protein J6Y07_00115 [Alphaproteobacteria bacterium]|nr:hypothetical protein [Alphaproteobacteria bacterium]